MRKSIKGMKDMATYYIVESTTATTVTWVQQIIFEQAVKVYVKEKQQHKMHMVEMFNTIHGQCTKEFVNQMCTYHKYEVANNHSDVIGLVKIIRKICYLHNWEMYKCQAILYSMKGLLTCLQHDSSNIYYFKKIRDQKEVLRSIGIQLAYEPLYKPAKGLLYPYKQLQHLLDTK